MNNSIIRKTVSLMSVVVSGWFMYWHKRRGSYRLGVQAAQNLNQRSVHFLRGSLEELPTTSHKQRVTCKGGVTRHQDQTRLLTPKREHMVPKGSVLPSLSSLQLTRRHRESQATLAAPHGLSATQTHAANATFNAGNPTASPSKPCQRFLICGQSAVPSSPF